MGRPGATKILALITARSGSKGLPGKNIRPLGGKPLVTWTVEQAKAANGIDRIVISSDDPEIIRIAVAAGCEAPFVRPAELARDDTPSAAVVLHALDALADPFDLLMLLQPTSPLRLASDIDACLDACLASGASSCITVTEAEHSPFWMFRLDQANRLVRLLDEGRDTVRRQDLPKAYLANGAVFVARVDWFRDHQAFVDDDTIGVVMPTERSIDIDTELDFRLAEMLLAERFARA